MFYAPCKLSDFFSRILFVVCIMKKMHFYISLLGCGHCKKAKPEFETAAGTVNTDEVYRMLGACLTTADKGSGKKMFYPNYSNISLSIYELLPCTLIFKIIHYRRFCHQPGLHA